MLARSHLPVAFLVTGFGWLALSTVLGLASLIGLVLGTPLPPWVRLVHVHAALVGGVAQMILGGFLAMVPLSATTNSAQQQTQPFTFWVFNTGAAGMLTGFWLHENAAVNAAGLCIAGACAWIVRVVWSRTRHSPPATPDRWYYTATVLAFFGGIACGGALAFTVVQEFYGYVRLAHIHLGLLGFITLVIIGVMHSLAPMALATPLFNPRLARIVSIVMPLGVAVLIGGFLNSSLSIELTAGGILLAGGTLYATNLVRTWRASTYSGNTASDHLLIGAFFFLFTVVLGILVGINSLSNPPAMPYGTVHLIAYTHMTFLGCILNSAMGFLSLQIPFLLSAGRVSSNKKRTPYHDQLVAIMNRWRAIQVGGLSLGTMGLGLLAALTWNVPLNSMPVRATTWICFALLLSSVLLFSLKLAMAAGQRPEETSH